MSFCNIIFAGVYLFKFKKKSLDCLKFDRNSGSSSQNLLFGLYMFFCVLLIYFGSKYNYTSVAGKSEVIHSFISNAKTILASIYIFVLVKYGFNKRTFIMFCGFVGLLLVEQSRWYFISVLVATCLFLQNTKKITNKQIIFVFFVFLILLSYVGLYRSNVEMKHLGLLVNPFYIEGDYGSYMILQTYDLIHKGSVLFYTFFLDYVIDPIVYLIPRFAFLMLGTEKDSFGIFQHFVSVHQSFLLEQYAPVGGFHYIAQASSALPFFGPLIITYLFARLTVYVENNAYKSKFHEISYYLYSSGFMFVFIKTIFSQTVKYYLTLAIPAYILFFVAKRITNAKSLH
jgi:hypothetical protein